MKRLAFFLFVFVIGLSVMAQDGYRPMLKEGRVWIDNAFTEMARWVITTRVGEDTIINNMKYYKLYETLCYYDDVQGEYYLGEKGAFDEKFRYLIREADNKRVYRYENGNDVLLFDFSLSVGKSLQRSGKIVQTVTAIDTITVNNCKYKRMTITEINWEMFTKYAEVGLDPNQYEFAWKHIGYWIEGIGSSRGFADYCGWGPSEGRGSILQACYDQDKLVFRGSDIQNPNIDPMVKKEKWWVYACHHYNEKEQKYDDKTTRLTYLIVGDTIINGKKYSILGNTSKYPHLYCGALREEGTTVYCIYPNTEEEVVFQELDPAKFPEEMANKYVVQKDTVIIRDNPYVRYQYQPKNGGKPMVAIEGIGFKDNGIAYGMHYNQPKGNSDYMELIYCNQVGHAFFNTDFDAQEYFPDGTKWTEIRLDTLKYDSWYSKVGDEWVPNFETIDYYVKGEYAQKDDKETTNTFKKVYSNGPEWTDSLALLIKQENNVISVSVLTRENEESLRPLCPGTAYQFDWSVGKGLYFEDIFFLNTTTEYPYYFYFGSIDEIKEGNFGGSRALKYVDLDGKAPDGIGNIDTKGGRIIQGIGITEWNDGECLFGPSNPYFAITKAKDRHYRSMLVHFERNGEVLYNVWPEKKAINGISILNKAKTSALSPLYDLQGRRIKGQPQKGMYIQGGQKYVK